MLVEIEHHYGWTLHEHPGELFEAACIAAEESHWEVFTPDNHRLERGPWAGDQTHNGSIQVVTLKRLQQFFGGAIEPGRGWFTICYRRHFPHGTTARDHKGRRWAHLSTDGFPHPAEYGCGLKPWRRTCSKWACIDDPRESMRDYPTLFGADSPAFELDAQPAATEAEIVRGKRLWHDTHLLDVVSQVESRRMTPTQAASRVRCGRGEGRTNLEFRAWKLAQELKGREFKGESGPALYWIAFREEKPDPAEMRSELMRLAGIRELVDAERESNMTRVRARHVTREAVKT